MCYTPFVYGERLVSLLIDALVERESHNPGEPTISGTISAGPPRHWSAVPPPP